MTGERELLDRLNRTIEAQGPDFLLVQARDVVEKLIRDVGVESHIAQLRLDRLMVVLKPSDALIVDMLTAFYGEDRDGWSMGKVRRMRAALAAGLDQGDETVPRRQGPVTEPPTDEWEYGWAADEAVRATMTPRGPRVQMDDVPNTPEALAAFPKGERIRRRKAGPWEVVPDE